MKSTLPTPFLVDQALTFYFFLSTLLLNDPLNEIKNAPSEMMPHYLCNLRAWDPHQLLLNTSHFLPLSLEKLLSYAGARLLIQLPRKSEILAPNFLRVDALRCFEIGSRAKKTVHTYPFHVLCTFVAISTYLHTCHLTACTMRPNRV